MKLYAKVKTSNAKLSQLISLTKKIPKASEGADVFTVYIDDGMEVYKRKYAACKAVMAMTSLIVRTDFYGRG